MSGETWPDEGFILTSEQTRLTRPTRGRSTKQIAIERIAYVENIQERRRQALEELRRRIGEIEDAMERDEAWLQARKDELEGPLSWLPETETE